MIEKLISHLSQFATEQRIETFDSKLISRTRYLTVVLEDIYQAHNASAVLRSCECFGIQDVHIIENKNYYHISQDVSMGSDKWLDIFRYNKDEENTSETIKSLKLKGYRIVATTPHKNDYTIEQFDLKKGKIALLFGTELNGLSQTAINMADEFVKIPMSGFTESLNISVAAALFIYTLSTRLRSDSNIQWQLSNTERSEIKLNWLRKSIKESDRIEKAFIKDQIHTNKTT